jgi:hypothetical protein
LGFVSCGSFTPVKRSIVAALTGFRCFGAGMFVGNACDPPRDTLPSDAVP